MSKKAETYLPWVEKYRPKSIKEMALPTAKVRGQKVELADELKNFVKNFFRETKKVNVENKKIRLFNRSAPNKNQKEELRVPSEKAAILLEGQPGIGKTSIVYALANDLNMEVIETNASDTRTRDGLERRLKETTKSRGIMDFIVESKQKLILIDEVDGIYGVQDRGAVPTIVDLTQNTQFPIIMCSNEYKSSLQSLYKKIRRFEVHPLSEDEILKIVRKILKREKITNLSNNDVKLVINKNRGDLRGIINDLQGIGQNSENSEENSNEDLILSIRRDSTEEIFTLIRELFENVSTLQQARNLTNKSDVDYNFLYKWVSENLTNFIKKNDEIANAFENLSLADVVFGRIRKYQYWALLPYFFDLFAGGVALSRKQKSPRKGHGRVVFPRFSARSTFSLTIPERTLIEKIKKIYEISQIEAVQDFLPFLRILCGSSRRQLKIISDWLDLDAKEKKLLTKK